MRATVLRGVEEAVRPERYNRVMHDSISDLRAYLDRSPTPYHGVSESVARLEACGYRPLRSSEIWDLSPGDRRIIVREGGSLIAFEIGSSLPPEAGFRIIAAHTDSPNLRIKPCPDVSSEGYRQLAVEPYGGLLLHTWLDRDLSIAGRVCLRTGTESQTVRVAFDRPLVRIPNLAIHLYRELASEGLQLDRQKHAVPLIGLEEGPGLLEWMVAELQESSEIELTPGDIEGFDLMLYDTQPAVVSGARGEFLHSSRIDNLASCHAALCALVRCAARPVAPFTRVVVLYDHEEVGSRTASGAASPFLPQTLERIVLAGPGDTSQGYVRSLAHSSAISVDMAHAVHPNYADRHEPGHRPVIGRGPVLKRNVNQAYASDSAGERLIRQLCERIGIELQHFVCRSDQPCGSSIGPISAACSGIPTVDIGNPMLSMHSCREMAGCADVDPMIDLLGAYFDPH